MIDKLKYCQINVFESKCQTMELKTNAKEWLKMIYVDQTCANYTTCVIDTITITWWEANYKLPIKLHFANEQLNYQLQITGNFAL